MQMSIQYINRLQNDLNIVVESFDILMAMSVYPKEIPEIIFFQK